LQATSRPFLVPSLLAVAGVRATSSTTGQGNKKKMGFVGLGNMGAHMASNLLKAGYGVVVFDVNPTATEKLKEKGAIPAASPREVAAQTTGVITMLPSSPHVEDVYCNPNTGILRAVKPGALLIDASTIDPLVARKINSIAQRDHGALMVDAPVSGGVVGAEAGTLTFMVGGTAEGYEAAKEVLKAMGRNIVHCGGAGNGQAVKLCNNVVLAISMIGVSEGMSLGLRLGLDAKLLAGIFNTSTARCWSSDSYNPVPGVMEGVPASRGYSGGFGVDLMAKDLSLALAAASAVGAVMPLAGVAHRLYQLISANGSGGKDFSSAFDFLHNHSKVRPAPPSSYLP